MPPNPLVTIVTPTFNHASFIGPCIESVIAQTYPDWELLIVNDGSNDATGAVAERYAKTEPRIHVFHRENVGVFRLAETYNHALERAKGAYVAVLEGDDVWHPEKLQRQVEAISQDEEAVLCWSRAGIMDDGHDQMRTTDAEQRHIPMSWRRNDPVGSALNGLYVTNFVPAASIFARADALREIGGFQQRAGLPLVDYPTLLELALKGRFVYVDAVLAKWRWHPNQVTRLFHTDIIERVRDVALQHHRDHAEALRPTVTVTRREIEANFQSVVHRAYVQSGRYKLVQQRFSDARRDFSNALWFGGLGRPLLRLQALAGIGSSFVRTDMEWIARLLGKTDLSWRQASNGESAMTPKEVPGSTSAYGRQ